MEKGVSFRRLRFIRFTRIPATNVNDPGIYFRIPWGSYILMKNISNLPRHALAPRTPPDTSLGESNVGGHSSFMDPDSSEAEPTSSDGNGAQATMSPHDKAGDAASEAPNQTAAMPSNPSANSHQGHRRHILYEPHSRHPDTGNLSYPCTTTLISRALVPKVAQHLRPCPTTNSMLGQAGIKVLPCLALVSHSLCSLCYALGMVARHVDENCARHRCKVDHPTLDVTRRYLVCRQMRIPVVTPGKVVMGLLLD